MGKRSPDQLSLLPNSAWDFFSQNQLDGMDALPLLIPFDETLCAPINEDDFLSYFKREEPDLQLEIPETFVGDKVVGDRVTTSFSSFDDILPQLNLLPLKPGKSLTELQQDNPLAETKMALGTLMHTLDILLALAVKRISAESDFGVEEYLWVRNRDQKETAADMDSTLALEGMSFNQNFEHNWTIIAGIAREFNTRHILPMLPHLRQRGDEIGDAISPLVVTHNRPLNYSELVWLLVTAWAKEATYGYHANKSHLLNPDATKTQFNVPVRLVFEEAELTVEVFMELDAASISTKQVKTNGKSRNVVVVEVDDLKTTVPLEIKPERQLNFAVEIGLIYAAASGLALHQMSWLQETKDCRKKPRHFAAKTDNHIYVDGFSALKNPHHKDIEIIITYRTFDFFHNEFVLRQVVIPPQLGWMMFTWVSSVLIPAMKEAKEAGVKPTSTRWYVK